MSDLPSTGDDGWDSHLRMLIDNIQKKQWLNALSLLITMAKQATVELNDVLKERDRG